MNALHAIASVATACRESFDALACFPDEGGDEGEASLLDDIRLAGRRPLRCLWEERDGDILCHWTAWPSRPTHAVPMKK